MRNSIIFFAGVGAGAYISGRNNPKFVSILLFIIIGIGIGCMPIVVEGISLEKYLLWINESINGIDSIESAGYNMSILGVIWKKYINKKRDFLNNIKKSSFFIGVKKGLEMDLLPKEVLDFLNKPIVRILRFIGGLNVTLFLLIKKDIIFIDMPIFLWYIIMIISFIQFSQMFIINFIKLFYGINKLIWHRKDFEVRNSPINRLASKLVDVIYCFKIGCTVTGGGITILGGTVVWDTALDSAGLNKWFEPYTSKFIRYTLGTGNNNISDYYKLSYDF